jgi:hypothetical protein
VGTVHCRVAFDCSNRDRSRGNLLTDRLITPDVRRLLRLRRSGDVLRAAQEHFEVAGFKFKMEFLTRCISAVAVGNTYFEGGFDKATPEIVQKAWNQSEKVLEYLVNIRASGQPTHMRARAKSAFDNSVPLEFTRLKIVTISSTGLSVTSSRWYV